MLIHKFEIIRMSPESKRSGLNKGLSLTFATCCIIDLFGILPVIALPRAIIDCGWFGLIITIVIFFIQIYTAIMLGRCWVIAEKLHKDIINKNRYPYAAIVELAYGKHACRYVTFVLGLAIFGGCVPNLQVASQDLQLIGLKLSSYKIDISYCYWIIILGVAISPCMWLGSPKDLKWLGLLSVTLVVTASFLTWYCLLEASGQEEPIIPHASWESTAVAVGILAFQFDVHPMVLTVQMDMKNRNELGKAIFIAFIVTGGLFVITVLICYSRFGTAIHYNALQGLVPSDALYIDFILVTVQIVLSAVVGISPLFQDLEHKLNIPPGFGWRRCTLRSAVIVAAIAIAEIVPRFDLIMGLIGGCLMGQIMFIVPPLLYARLRMLYAREFPKKPMQTVQIGYGSFANVIRYNTATITGSHTRTDLSMEDHLDKPELFLRPKISKGLKEDLQNNSYLDFTSLDHVLYLGQLTVQEKVLNIFLILFGIIAAVLSTCYTLKEIVEYATFVPPCIGNFSLSSDNTTH